MNNYGPRSCLFCGKMFTAVRLQQFFCSAECQRKRKNDRSRGSKLRCKERARLEREALEKRVAELESEVASLTADLKVSLKELEAAQEALKAAQAELEPHTPVVYDEDGTPRYSARHWADRAEKIAIAPPTAEQRGSIRVGEGLHLENGEDGQKDVLVPDTTTTEKAGIARPDGTTITILPNGVISTRIHPAHRLRAREKGSGAGAGGYEQRQGFGIVPPGRRNVG